MWRQEYSKVPLVQQDPDLPPITRGRIRRALLRVVLSVVALVLLVGLTIGTLGVVLSGRQIPLPAWGVSILQAQANKALHGHARLELGGVRIFFEAGHLPEITLDRVELRPAAGGGRLRLPEVVTSFDVAALLHARVEPVEIRIRGAHMLLRRDINGDFDFDFGESEGESPGSVADVLAEVEAFFALPTMQSLREVRTEALSVRLIDRRAERLWTVGDGMAVLRRREGGGVTLGLNLSLLDGDRPARAQLRMALAEGGRGAAMSVRVDDIAAVDLAQQAPALGFLDLLEAPISGDMRLRIDGQGAMVALEGSLNVGAGLVRPVPGIQPLTLNRAQLAFGLEPDGRRLRIDRLEVDGPHVRFSADAHVDLVGMRAGIPEAFVAQMHIDEMEVSPDGIFAEPLRFTRGTLDSRLKLDPFSLDLGNLSLAVDDTRLDLHGNVSAGPEGWTMGLDVAADQITHDRMLAMWPVTLVPRTREWLEQNVKQGVIFGVKAGLRIRPDHEPRLSLGYEFRDGDVRYLPTLPPIQRGRGYAVIEGATYTTVVEDGVVIPPEGGEIQVRRSVFRVPSVDAKPTLAEITLQTDSTVTAALSLLDQPPFEFMTRAGLPADLAEGRAELRTRIAMPLVKDLKIDAVDFDVEGTLHDVVSNRLVPGKVLRADRLELLADREEISVSGGGLLGHARFDARWAMKPFGGGGASRVTGTARIDDGLVREFLSALPPGSVAGNGQASFTIDIPKGAAPRLNARSNLVGVRLSVPQLGWSKAAPVAGNLVLDGVLRTPIRFDRLQLSAPGLQAEGTLRLTGDGRLDVLDVSRLVMGRWLDVHARIRGQAPGVDPVIEVTGGRVDIRAMPDRLAAGGGGGQSSPIELRLDRVQLTDKLALHAFQGRIGGGAIAPFTASLNGRAPLRGQLMSSRQGMGVRLASDNGGAVLAATGIFESARGGQLVLEMMPTGQKGHYQGSFTMGRFTVQNLPVMLELVNAISIVGLVDQIRQSGAVFDEAAARFRLTPDALEVREGRAIGASFGVSLEGVYHITGNRLNLQGVVSPLYLINGIASFMTRPGEGLVGMNYRIQGSASRPDVSVNPLSVLAPSFFRDLLRRPAERLK